MRTLISRTCKVGLLAAALLIPVSTTTSIVWAQARTYHDAEHNQDHEWNSNEDKAYRRWLKENHRKYGDFAKLKEEDQRAYWAWRHDHPDAEKKH